MSKLVEVVQIPSVKKHVTLDDRATVGDAVRAAGWEPKGYNISVSDDTSATAESLVSNGSRVVLTRQVKGATTITA